MKKILTIAASLSCTLGFAQVKRLTDSEFNHPKVACYVNGTFVKSFIGFDTSSPSACNKINTEYFEKPIIINNNEYQKKVFIKFDKKITFVTLDDICKQYCPEVKEPIVFMIDWYFITNDVKSYKLDKDYIEKCETISSLDFDVFKQQSPFSIVRIFTKDKEYGTVRIQ